MQLDSQKIRLIRAYARADSPRYKPSPSGLEKFLPRTSSPTRESLTYVDNNPVCDPYELFRHCLERRPPQISKVRGMKNPPYHFICGHLIEPPTPPKTALKARFDDLKRVVRRFFDKCKNMLRKKCDYSFCPPTCECQRMKSMLNKTVCLDDNEEIKVSSAEG